MTLGIMMTRSATARKRKQQPDDPLEGYIVDKVKAFAKKLGWTHRKVVYVGRHGAPDDWFFNTGSRIIMIEFKRRGRKPTEIQMKEIEHLRSLGFDVRIVDNIDSGISIFQRIADEERFL